MKTFEHRSIIPATIDQMIAFHEDPRALSVLSMPPIIIQMHKRDWRSMRDALMDFTLWVGPIPAHWKAVHEPGVNDTSFRDRMVEGPMETWIHDHIMTPVTGGVELIDRIQIAHRASGFWSIFSRVFFDGLPLRILFIYRHWRTRLAVKNYPQVREVTSR